MEGRVGRQIDEWMDSRWLKEWIGQKEDGWFIRLGVPILPAHLTIFVCSHQLVYLLIGPGSQNFNEALLVCANALQKRRDM